MSKNQSTGDPRQSDSPRAGDGETDLSNQPADDIQGVTLTERFENFHRRNPHFYDAIVKLARRFRAKTGRTCGIQRLFEIARFDIEMELVGDEEFRVNNDYAAFYARLIMASEADLVEFFNLRRATEADLWICELARRAA